MSSYTDFLNRKRIVSEPVGFDVDASQLNSMLFPFQRDIATWALRRGRAAIFADCGLGKTPMQLEWAQHVYRETGRNVLIIAPLAVSQQTAREAEKFGLHVTVCRSQSEVRDGINVTNYEMIEHFQSEAFGGVVLDESSRLKAYDGNQRKQFTAFAEPIPYRLACTATPAPNDLVELINHAEFLGIMSGKEIKALFFTQDGNTTHQWRLKGHAKHDFWRWLASWSVAIRKPSDLGYDDDGFVLPPIVMNQITVEAPPPEGMLFSVEALDLDTQRKSRRASLSERVQACADIVNGSPHQWIVWCELNDESEALARAIPDAVEVRGGDTREFKETAILDFLNRTVRVIISKSSIFGFGLNLQQCSHVAFVGVSHSYEQWYQAIRRCWRFGQSNEVRCYVVVSDADGPIVRNLERKEAQASEMMREIVAHMAGLSLGKAERTEMDYTADKPLQLPQWINSVEERESA